MREIRLVRGVENELSKKETEIHKGDLKKQEAPAKKLDARMEKIEKRTDHLLNKAQTQEAKKIERIEVLNNLVLPAIPENSAEGIAEAYVKRSLIKRRASYIEFLCMKGIKKQILLSIKENAFQENGQWLSVLNTADIEQRTSSKASIIRDAIYRMKEEGWFEIIHSSNSGSRLLKIYPEHFKV
jgi:hypothetical protein